MRWSLVLLAAAAIASLIASAGACGSVITVPDQGIIVTGCQQPSACFKTTCPCSRASIGTGDCVTSCTDVFVDLGVGAICECPNDPSDGGIVSQCLETAQACVGRGVFCGGAGALCVPAGSACAASTAGAQPPMLIPTIGTPMLEPHCQFTDDVCCPGAAGNLDGGTLGD